MGRAKYWDGSKWAEMAPTAQEFDEHSAGKASKTTYGHMKVGNGLKVTDGVVSTDVIGELVIERFETPGTYTWKVPTGVTKVYVSGCGGGGPGYYRYEDSTAGGITSFGSLLSLSGGGAGTSKSGGAAGGVGGVDGSQGFGGDGLFGVGGISLTFSSFIAFKKAFGYGSGGRPASSGYFGGGAGEAVVDKLINVTSGANISIKVGDAGVASISDPNYSNSRGGSGLLVIKYIK